MYKTNTMKKIGSSLIFIVCLISSFLSLSQTTFTAKTSSTIVGVGEGFRVDFTINARDVKYFRNPTVKGARIVAGPMTSTSYSSSNINGKVTSSSKTTFSFTLVADKEGTITVSPAKVDVNRKTYTSNSLTLTASKNHTSNRQNNSSQHRNNYNNYSQQIPAQQNNNNQQIQIDDKAMFVRAIPGTTTPVKGEQVIITYKLYSLIDVSEYSMSNIPSTSGFWIEELDYEPRPQLTWETYNGQRYQTAILKTIIVYPQKSGVLTIKPMPVNLSGRILSRQRQTFADPFFNNFFPAYTTSVRNVQKEVRSNAVKLNVSDLTQKPDNFFGGVGQFQISGDVSSKQAKAYEPFYLTYTLSGSGNLTLINNLPLELPDEFQLSDPEINDNIQRTTSGLSGTRTFRYLVIPRIEGKFNIPDLCISYFNTKTRTYDTLTLQGYELQVAKGDVNSDFADQLDARLKYRNMKIIDKPRISSLAKEYHLFDSALVVLIPVILIALLVVSIFMYSHYLRLCSDVAGMKMKKSTRIAIKRLKKAKSFLDKNEMETFEDETAIALWTYLEDRFKMDRTQLSIQGCKDELLSLNINSTTVETLGTILERCQYLRFSQDKTATADITLYNDTVEVISSIEEQMKTLKKIKKQPPTRPEHEIHIPDGLSIALILLASCFMSHTAQAQDAKQYCHKADSCFKQSNYAEAILYYEKALKFAPSNKDIKQNINITRAHLVGDTYIMPEFILVRWAKYVSGLLAIPVWFALFVACFLAACVVFFFYIFRNEHKVLRFYISIALLIVSLSSMGFGIIRQNIQNDLSHAIVIKSNIHLRQSKNNGAKDVSILYKGQKIKILDNDGSAWIKARTEDNKVGYMENKYFIHI